VALKQAYVLWAKPLTSHKLMLL